MTDITAPPTLGALFELWMSAPVIYAGPTERYDREQNFRKWAVDNGLIKGIDEEGKTVKVVTRYGGFTHLARPALFDSRHFTLCTGTSSWTLASWEAEPDHPSLTIEEIRALPLCERCAKAKEVMWL